MRLRGGIILLVIGLVLAIVYLGGQARRLSSERNAWIRQAALNDSLHQLDAGRYQRVAVELDNERYLRATLKDSLPVLHRELRRIRAREHSYVYTIASLQSDTARVVATDTVYVSTGGINVSRVDFQFDYDGATVTGFTTTPPPEATARIEYRPIPFSIVVSQLRDRSWRTNVETAPWVEISVLNTQVVPQQPGWWARNRHWVTLASGFVLGSLFDFK